MTLATTQNVKQQLSEAFLAHQHAGDLAALARRLDAINTTLAADECFVLRPKSHASLSIVGPGANGQLHERAILCEPVHSFRGCHFETTTKGEIVLRANPRVGTPWCALAFHPETGTPSFNLEIVSRYAGVRP